jgi:hypothetical protein
MRGGVNLAKLALPLICLPASSPRPFDKLRRGEGLYFATP